MQSPNKNNFQNPQIAFLDDIKHFSEPIREIELAIVAFFAEVGVWNGRFPKLSSIYAYFLFHQTLTQKQIRQLTGYSKGSVSLYVNQMEEQGLITKKFIEGTSTIVASSDEGL